MNTPEEIERQEGQDAAKQSDTRSESVMEHFDLPAAVRQLRTLVCGLGAGLLVVSLGLSAFVYKQNRNLMGAITARDRQIAQLQVNQRPLMFAFNELGKYSVGKPELMAIFARHGVQITSTSEAGAPAPKSLPPVQ